MESITIKVDKNMGKRIEQAMKSGYSTKTEFIRDAIRDKLENMNRDELIKEFMKLKGRFKGRTTLSEDRKIREEVSKELEKELDRRFK
ncbi:ribbon-helix-helix domain-containing protein [candidate division KSB1 bacterium]